MQSKYSFLIKVFLILSLSFIVSSPMVLSTGQLENASVEISSISKVNGGFVISLTNTGDTFVRGLRLKINVTGGWIKPVDFHYNALLFSCNCTDVFQPGDTFNISTVDYGHFFSIGFLEISVQTLSFATGDVSAQKSAFIFCSFIIIL